MRTRLACYSIEFDDRFLIVLLLLLSKALRKETVGLRCRRRQMRGRGGKGEDLPFRRVLLALFPFRCTTHTIIVMSVARRRKALLFSLLPGSPCIIPLGSFHYDMVARQCNGRRGCQEASRVLMCGSAECDAARYCTVQNCRAKSNPRRQLGNSEQHGHAGCAATKNSQSSLPPIPSCLPCPYLVKLYLLSPVSRCTRFRMGLEQPGAVANCVDE